MKRNPCRHHQPGLLLFTLSMLLFVGLLGNTTSRTLQLYAPQTQNPAIEFTQIPAYGSSEKLTGKMLLLR